MSSAPPATAHATPQPAPGVAWPDAQREAAFQRWFQPLADQLGLRAETLAPASADASFRRYLRLQGRAGTLIVMDAPPPQEDVRPFVQVAGLLDAAGLNAPRIVEADADDVSEADLRAFLADTLETTLELLDGAAADDPALYFFRLALLHEERGTQTLAALAQASRDGQGVDHLRTGFPLTGAHASQRCESCHAGGQFKGTPRTCNTCHLPGSRFSRNNVVMPASHYPTSQSCDTCHGTTRFAGARFNHAGVTLHIDNLKGFNAHHQCETMFKAFGRTLRAALERDPRSVGVIPSTKGSL